MNICHFYFIINDNLYSNSINSASMYSLFWSFEIAIKQQVFLLQKDFILAKNKKINRIYELVGNFKLPERLPLYCVNDNGANVKLAVTLSCMKEYNCVNHTL